ncbi:MAG TPA: hypothetical protein VJB96_01900 [Patescibacteria group bacterium]|nr:hypothetical protein [Patescibacteria group bacterium]
MSESINETVSVVLWNNAPYSFSWHGRKYRIKTVGMHHTIREGRHLFHIFSVSDDSTFFKLVMDTETLGWKLVATYAV